MVVFVVWTQVASYSMCNSDFFSWVRLEGCIDQHLLHPMPRTNMSGVITILSHTTLYYAQKEFRLYFYTLFTFKERSLTDARTAGSGRSIFDLRSEEEFSLHCRVDTGSEYLNVPICKRCWRYYCQGQSG